MKSFDFQSEGVPVGKTPSELGYFFPAEFSTHQSTWLSWPHKEASWPGKISTIFPVYAQFIKEVAKGEFVNINVVDSIMESSARELLNDAGVDLNKIIFHRHPTNDAWCRDHGPAFLVRSGAASKELPQKVVVDWGYNAWGNKYPPYDLDDVIPTSIGKKLGLPVFHPGIVMEGGSVDFNGQGTVLTTTACLLNPNRNPHLNQGEIESYLKSFYGVQQILWLGDGIVGDDTDGHVDDITRFVNEDTVLTVVESDRSDANHEPLEENLRALKKMKLINGSALNIVELPMPSPVVYEGQRLPASYANFYIANHCVIVPTFRDQNDDKALRIIENCFPGKKVVGLDSWDIIWGLGSFHCLSQQEPAL